MMPVHVGDAILSAQAKAMLHNLQEKIDTESNWNQKVTLAKKKWDCRPKDSFQEIVGLLQEASAGELLCAYCENDRSAELEHVFNKKLFPNRTFWFSNYLMVCGKCNRQKLDAFAVFVNDETEQYTEYKKRGKRIQPDSDRHVFIDPRQDDPQNYFRINLTTGIIEIRRDATDRQKIKANYTRNLLRLNEDRALKENRSKAVDQFLDQVNKYKGCRDSTSFDELEPHFPSRHRPISKVGTLEAAKKFGQKLAFHHIATHKFPSVWREMKRQFREDKEFQLVYPHIHNLLAQVPELLL